MSYKNIFIICSLFVSMALVTGTSQANEQVDDWNDLVQEVQRSSPFLFVESEPGKKKSSEKESESVDTDKGGNSKKEEELTEKEKKAAKARRKAEKEERKRKKKATRKLRQAVKDNDYELVKVYVLAGGDTNDAAKKTGLSLLHIAAANGNIHIVRVLATHGADIHAVTVKDWTPLHHAARFGNLGVVKYLMQKGASMFVVNSDGKNPYTLARQLKHDEIIRFMDIWRKYH